MTAALSEQLNHYGCRQAAELLYGFIGCIDNVECEISPEVSRTFLNHVVRTNFEAELAEILKDAFLVKDLHHQRMPANALLALTLCEVCSLRPDLRDLVPRHRPLRRDDSRSQ